MKLNYYIISTVSYAFVSPCPVSPEPSSAPQLRYRREKFLLYKYISLGDQPSTCHNKTHFLLIFKFKFELLRRSKGATSPIRPTDVIHCPLKYVEIVILETWTEAEPVAMLVAGYIAMIAGRAVTL